MHQKGSLKGSKKKYIQLTENGDNNILESVEHCQSSAKREVYSTPCLS